MPGVIMENGSSNGAHTNHDRDSMPNGVNGASYAEDRAFDKAKGRQEPQQPVVHAMASNGGSNGATVLDPAQPQVELEHHIPKDVAAKLQQLPPEILHITEGFESLSTLLSRLSQVSHNRLSAKIQELASMATPTSAMNGNGVYHGNGSDDNSGDNVRKKVELLKFAEKMHADWTKALVITHWSRISEDVGKLIDVKVHVDNQKSLYDGAVYELSELKRSLVHARVPNPDLKTAVEVLSTGKASWMPDLGYIDPPPLTAIDLTKSLQNLNTLLSIRLNLSEYEKIPIHFKHYTIKSGRVIFRVEGEFEVDLTIADENPESQFWFIDFRFLFSPSLSELPENLRFMIESRVNTALGKDGLAGCHKFLHELVLTHKISELRRQALDLSRGRWIEKLRVEPLRRALSIQYWVDRYNKDGKDGPKSWIILGVQSGKRQATFDPKATSRISLRWFRDGKEFKDLDMQLELTELSTESLLHNIISRHIDHVLSSTYKTLSTKQLFSTKDLFLSYSPSTSTSEPILKVQLTRQQSICITIEPVTGEFAISPASKLSQHAQSGLNKSKDPATHAFEYIQNLRCVAISEEIISRALSVGWQRIPQPTGLKQEDLKPIVPRDTLQMSWFRRSGWCREWTLALSSSMSGERWWLLELKHLDARTLQISSQIQVPLKTNFPNPTHEFLSSLHLFTAAMISNHANLRALHARRSSYMLQSVSQKIIASPIKLPTIFVKTRDLLASRNKSPRTGKPWAKEIIKISFQGLEYHSESKAVQKMASPVSQQASSTVVDTQLPDTTSEPRKTVGDVENGIIVAETSLIKTMPPGLNLVKQRVDKDIAFHPNSGSFAFRLRTKIGESSIPALIERLQSVEQLVDFVAVVKRHEKDLNCEKISLGQLVFSYRNKQSSNMARYPNSMVIGETTGTHRATINFGDASAPMAIKFETKNPHIRVIDHLTRILNERGLGLDAVATCLPLTLNVMKGLMDIENNWNSLTDQDQGEVLVLDRAIDWHTIRYCLPATSLDQKERKLTLDIKLEHRRGKAWWCVRRVIDQVRGSASQNSTAVDEIDAVLKTIWDCNEEGQKWRGMSTSAIALPEDAAEMLSKVDAVVRRYTANGLGEIINPTNTQLMTPATSQQAQLPSYNSQQQQKQQEQPQRQQPQAPMNQNQNQNQNRTGRTLQPVVIDID